MKKILTAIAFFAMPGAALAGSHSSVAWGGDIELGYNNLINNGFYLNTGVNITLETDLDNDVTATVTIGGNLNNSAGGIEWDNFPTLIIKTDWLTFSVGEIGSAADDMFNSVSGMNLNNAAIPDDEIDFFSPGGEMIVRVDVKFGEIIVAISGDAPNFQSGGPVNNPSIGISGAIGELDFGLGYDTLGDRDVASVVGANVEFEIGRFDVEMAYQIDGEGDSAFGLGANGRVGEVDITAYYAINSSNANEYGAAIDVDIGEVDVEVYWDGEDGAAPNSGVDLRYEVSGDLTTYAGFDQADGFYFGAILKIAIGAEFGVSLAADAGGEDHGPKDFKDGISTWFSAEF